MGRRPRVFIDGEAGTTGLEIRGRLQGRDEIELVSIDPARRKDDGERRRLLNDVDLAILCLPDEAARSAVALIENPAVRVLDASTAHRVAPGWVYGFPELTAAQADLIAGAKRVSNPGCYPTGALALLRPLVEQGLIPGSTPLAIQGLSGYSGGGRQMIDAFEGRAEPAITDPYRAYALDLAHKHLAEMQRHAGLAAAPLFSPAVGAFRQGMLVQIPLLLWSLPGQLTGAVLRDCLSAHYAGQPYIRVVPSQEHPAVLAPEGLNGTNNLELFVFANDQARTALLVARLDNLGKGASGAAVQNMELMLGLTQKK